jgi:hypothetical protein
MTQNVFNPHPLGEKIHPDNQTVFTAANIKNKTIIDQVNCSKGFFHFNKSQKLILVTNGPPGIKGIPGLGISVGKLVQNLSCNNMHIVGYPRFLFMSRNMF